MTVALDQLEKLDPAQYSKEYNKYYCLKIKKSVMSNLSSSSKPVQEPKYSPHSIKIHCRDCSRELFKASDLKYREPSYFCLNAQFIETKIKVDSSTKKFFCSDGSCNKELGRLVEFKSKQTLHMIEIRGIKFVDQFGNAKNVSKWNKAKELFQINEL